MIKYPSLLCGDNAEGEEICTGATVRLERSAFTFIVQAISVAVETGDQAVHISPYSGGGTFAVSPSHLRVVKKPGREVGEGQTSHRAEPVYQHTAPWVPEASPESQEEEAKKVFDRDGAELSVGNVVSNSRHYLYEIVAVRDNGTVAVRLLGEDEDALDVSARSLKKCLPVFQKEEKTDE